MKIRRTTPDDAEALVRIHGDMGEHYADLAPERFHRPELDGFAAIIAAEIAEDPQFLRLVAEIDGEVVGSLDAQLLPSHEQARHAFNRDLLVTRMKIEYLAVAAGHRRTGAGTALVEAAEAWAREHGAVVAELTTYQDSPLAYPFWTERVGYSPRSVNLRKDL